MSQPARRSVTYRQQCRGTVADVGIVSPPIHEAPLEVLPKHRPHRLRNDIGQWHHNHQGDQELNEHPAKLGCKILRIKTKGDNALEPAYDYPGKTGEAPAKEIKAGVLAAEENGFYDRTNDYYLHHGPGSNDVIECITQHDRHDITHKCGQRFLHS